MRRKKKKMLKKALLNRVDFKNLVPPEKTTTRKENKSKATNESNVK